MSDTLTRRQASTDSSSHSEGGAEGAAPENKNRNSKQQEQHDNTALIIGNLNVGKTTLFNRLCGKHSKVSNYPGTSVQIGRGTLSESGSELQLIDTPGIDSMMPESEDETITQAILLREKPDIIVQIADGKNLRKSLLLMMQVAEFELPCLFNINMMDEIPQRGIDIDVERFVSLLGVPVTTTIATEGKGIGAFRKAFHHAQKPNALMTYPERIESAIVLITKLLKDSNLPARAVAVAMLAGDSGVKQYVADQCGMEIAEQIEAVADNVQFTYSQPISAVILKARLDAVDRIIADVQTITPPARMPLSEKIGQWSREPLTGIPIALMVLAFMYLFVGQFGAHTLVEFTEYTLFAKWIVPAVAKQLAWIPYPWIIDAFVGQFGVVSLGLTLAFGVVTPVLATFFLVFGILEESGYLPRLSILLDRLLAQIGLNGKGILPLILGFSCGTMALLSTRILETKRERFIATVLLCLGLPCAPALAVILVLLSQMSIWATVIVAGIVLTQIILTGFVLGKVLPGFRSDFILEVPPMRVPQLKGLIGKTLWRIWWFIKEAVPLFMLATFALFVLEQLGMLTFLEHVGRPIMCNLLGLPPEGVEVAIMTAVNRGCGAALLKQYSDTGVFDSVDVLVGILLVMFLCPCVNAVLVMLKERGVKGTLAILACVIPYALFVGATVSWVCRGLGVHFK